MGNVSVGVRCMKSRVTKKATTHYTSTPATTRKRNESTVGVCLSSRLWFVSILVSRRQPTLCPAASHDLPGDCCECTCAPRKGEYDLYGCTQFACIDPSARCVDDDDITVDMVASCPWINGVGDGHCWPELNTPECNYDGGGKPGFFVVYCLRFLGWGGRC